MLFFARDQEQNFCNALSAGLPSLCVYKMVGAVHGKRKCSKQDFSSITLLVIVVAPILRDLFQTFHLDSFDIVQRSNYVRNHSLSRSALLQFRKQLELSDNPGSS